MKKNMVYLLWAILIGGIISIQASTNSALRLQINSPLIATFVNFSVGLITLAIIVAIFKPDAFSSFKPIFMGKVPLWKLIGGMLGVFFVASVTVLAPKLGVGKMIILYLFGQILIGLVIDHFGLFGMPISKITLQKTLGVILVLTGIVLVQK